MARVAVWHCAVVFVCFVCFGWFLFFVVLVVSFSGGYSVEVGLRGNRLPKTTICGVLYGPHVDTQKRRFSRNMRGPRVYKSDILNMTL